MANETLPPFQALLDEHGSDVLGFLVASVGPHDAEDCFQETFIAALRGVPEAGARGQSALLAADDRAPQGDRPPPRPCGAAPFRPAAPDEVAGGSSRARTAGPTKSVAGGDPELWTAVSGLPPKQRSAVVLRFATDMAYAGIAKALDCSQDAARRSVHEGLKKLRGEFA